MARYARLTVDLDAELARTRIVPPTGFVPRFVERAFATVSSREFAVPETDAFVVLRPRNDNSIEIQFTEGLVFAGDRLRFWAYLEAGRQTRRRQLRDIVEISDGAAALIEHIVARADPFVLQRILEIAPATAVAVSAPQHDRSPVSRKRWQSLLRDVLSIMVDADIRGPAALVGAQSFLMTLQTSLAFEAHERESLVSFGEILPPRDRERQRRGLERVLSGTLHTFGSDVAPPDPNPVIRVVEGRARPERR